MTIDWQWHDNIEISNLDTPGRHQGVVQWKYVLQFSLYQVSNRQHI